MKKILYLIFYLLSLKVVASPSSIVILQYHNVSEHTPKTTSISPKVFEQHLAYLAEHRFNVLSLAQFYQHFTDKTPFPDKAVLITFDDGYDSIYHQALPLLKAKGFPFTVFINIEPITQKLPQFMTWQQLKMLTLSGATIANHSITHDHLIRVKSDESVPQWRARVTHDIVQAQQEIDKELGSQIKAFAYPFGEYNNELANIIDQLGYIGFGQQSGATGLSSDHRFLPRFPFGGNYTEIDDFALKVHTLAMPLAKVRVLAMDGLALDDNVLPDALNKAQLELTLLPESQGLNIDCYMAGHGRLAKKNMEDRQIFYPEKLLAVGRDKFNCTAASPQKGRFYWFSQLLIKKHADGTWYQEP